jgi:hypothetical protein
MTKIEKIHNLLEDVETDLRDKLIKDILETLGDFRKDCPKNQEDGLTAAIGIIKGNF